MLITLIRWGKNYLLVLSNVKIFSSPFYFIAQDVTNKKVVVNFIARG